MLEQQLNADTSDRVGALCACPTCAGMARYAGRRGKRLVTVLGPIDLRRAYYVCGACQAGFCPRDRERGLVDSSLSPAVLRMVGTVGSMVSFEEGSALLRDLAGVRVDAKQVERSAERLGQQIADDERAVVELPEPQELATTLYCGVDGTGIPMRPNELAGRPGKQPDGSAKTREVKLCAVFSAEHRDADGTPVRDLGSVSYSAAIESAACHDVDTQPSEFAQRVQRETTRRGFDRATRRVILGDGAPWIWNLADDLFPGAIQIVDRFHVKETLSRVAKAIFGPDSDLAPAWAKLRHAELDTGNLDGLINQLAAHATIPQAACCGDYIRRNRQRMRYPEFHAHGLCTSSGVIEAACKVVIGARLKQSGMHWSRRGANAITALRCCRLSGRFEDFWQRRAQRAKAA